MEEYRKQNLIFPLHYVQLKMPFILSHEIKDYEKKKGQKMVPMSLLVTEEGGK